MPARRKPATVLKLVGAFDANPQRERIDPPSPAYDYANKSDRNRETKVFRHYEEAHAHLVDTLPRNVLRKRDRIYLEIAARLMCLMRREGVHGIEPAKLNLLEKMLSKLGLNPSDAARVATNTAKTANEFDM